MNTTLLKLFWACFRVGAVAFGGGNTAIPLLEAEAVPLWISQQEYAELVGINFAFPGVSIVKLTGMVGMKAAGGLGIFVAIIGLLVPGLVITFGAYQLLQVHRDTPVVRRGLLAVQYASAALLVSTAWKLLPVRAAPRSYVLGGVLFLGVLLSVQLFRASPIACILAAIVIGCFVF